MSRFVDRKATRPIDLGECKCPGNPHDRDKANVSVHQSYSDWLALVDAGNRSLEEYTRVRFLRRLKSWNLVNEQGKAVPITSAILADLDTDTSKLIQDALNEIDGASEEDSPELPNASSAPSATS